MWELLNSQAHAPFTIAGLILLILLVVEILSFMFGGLSGFLDNVVPDSLLDADFDADADIDFDGDLSIGLKALDWLYVGRIPTMILLILLIGSFCISGLIIQQISLSFLGTYLSPWLASLNAVVVSIPLLRVLAKIIYPIMPKDETSAVSGDSLVGKPATLVIGHTRIGSPAQAKVIDDHGLAHYIMVEPDPDYMPDNSKMTHTNSITLDGDTPPVSQADSFDDEDSLIITKKTTTGYLVTRTP